MREEKHIESGLAATLKNFWWVYPVKRDFSTIILAVLFTFGLALLLYPPLSNYWNSKKQTRAIFDYESNLSNQSSEAFLAEFAKADRYNKELSALGFPLIEHEKVADYDNILNINGNGMMGYITIEKLDLNLPIYHGTSDSVLSMAVGHLKGSSLPVGGKETHSILTAHRGLPTSKLFTNLDRLEKDDIFSINLLDRVLFYRVDQILIVEPRDINAILIEENKDYCTLLTCTPYGINTKRLLVRGSRIEKAPDKILKIQSEAIRIPHAIVIPLISAPMFFLLFVRLLIKYRKKP